MSEKKFESIRKELSAAHKRERDPWAYAYRTDVPVLLAEVERLRGDLLKTQLVTNMNNSQQKKRTRYRSALEEISDYPPFDETNNGDRYYEQMRSLASQALQGGDTQC